MSNRPFSAGEAKIPALAFLRVVLGHQPILRGRAPELLDGRAGLAVQLGIEDIDLAAYDGHRRLYDRHLAGIVFRLHRGSGDQQAIGIPDVKQMGRAWDKIDRLGGSEDFTGTPLSRCKNPEVRPRALLEGRDVLEPLAVEGRVKLGQVQLEQLGDLRQELRLRRIPILNLLDCRLRDANAVPQFLLGPTPPLARVFDDSTRLHVPDYNNAGYWLSRQH